jgi:prolyl 4-hydroxylase
MRIHLLFFFILSSITVFFSFFNTLNINVNDINNNINNSLEIFKIGHIQNQEIKLLYIPTFLSIEDCQHLINISYNKFQRSEVIFNNNFTYDDSRTSSSHYFEKSEDLVIKNIEERVAFLTNKSIDDIEELQIVRYQPGQFFHQHYDWFNEDYVQKYDVQRQYTIFVYLNDVKEAGETIFPELNKSYKPKTGIALFWENCISKNTCHSLALHRGLPPKEEIKYGLNIWIKL